MCFLEVANVKTIKYALVESSRQIYKYSYWNDYNLHSNRQKEIRFCHSYRELILDYGKVDIILV